MKYFEFACTRNEWRSPVAEFIAQNHIKKLGLEHTYWAISSGSHRDLPDPNEVQSTSENNVPIESMINLINFGLQQNIFSAQEKEEISKNITSRDGETLQQFFAKANKVFKDHERYFRADAVHRLVEEKWLSGYLKAHADQTTVKQDVIAVFAMAPNNTEKIREIYKGNSHQPLIETLSVYATWDTNAKLPNAFAQWEKFYHNVIDQLLEQIPLAINRYIKENTT